MITRILIPAEQSSDRASEVDKKVSENTDHEPALVAERTKLQQCPGVNWHLLPTFA